MKVKIPIFNNYGFEHKEIDINYDKCPEFVRKIDEYYENPIACIILLELHKENIKLKEK